MKNAASSIDNKRSHILCNSRETVQCRINRKIQFTKHISFIWEHETIYNDLSSEREDEELVFVSCDENRDFFFFF